MAVDQKTVHQGSQIIKKLNLEIKKIKGRTKEGLLEAALLIRERTIPLTPIETGDLRTSFYVEPEGFVIEIGTELKYAVPVHERVEAHHDVGGAKYLEKAVDESRKDVVNIIKARAKI